MDFDLIQPIRFIIGILKSFGLWHLNNKWEFIYIGYSYILHIFTTILTTVSMWASVFTAADLEEFSEALYMSLTEVALLVKVINIFKLRKVAVEFFELVQSEPLLLKNSKEVTLFEDVHRVFFLVARFYTTACVLVIGTAFAVVGFGQKWILPYPAWMPFDLHSGYFWYAYSFQFVCMMVTCLTNASIDILQAYFLHHLSAIYRVIGLRLENIGFDIRHGDNSSQVNELILNEVTDIIKVHLLVKRITAQSERFISFPIFMQLLLSALVICFTGYQLTNISPLQNTGKFLGMVDYLLVMGLQIFIPCYYAHQVTIQAGMLSEALYNSNWVAFPQKSKKLIYLLMEFFKEPVQLKAAKFFNIGLPIFSKTINNAYSCFAVLLRMKN